MSMYGANPEQLAALGTRLRAQQEGIDAIVATVSTTLGATTWTGPARDRFESDWSASFRPALDRLKEAFAAAGTDCQQRASDLLLVMGAG